MHSLSDHLDLTEYMLQEAVRRVRETLPLSQRPGGASNIHGGPEGHQRHEYVAFIQVETEGSAGSEQNINLRQELNVIFCFSKERTA